MLLSIATIQVPASLSWKANVVSNTLKWQVNIR